MDRALWRKKKAVFSKTGYRSIQVTDEWITPSEARFRSPHKVKKPFSQLCSIHSDYTLLQHISSLHCPEDVSSTG